MRRAQRPLARRTDASSVCWSCQLQQRSFSSLRPAREASSPLHPVNTLRGNVLSRAKSARLVISSRARRPQNSTNVRHASAQPAVAASDTPTDLGEWFAETRTSPKIRDRLRAWQEEFGTPNEDIEDMGVAEGEGEEALNVHNDARKDPDKFPRASADDTIERDAAIFRPGEDFEGIDTHGLVFRPGDLVELYQPASPTTLAVFVQAFSNQAQFYTHRGKWIHRYSNLIQFHIPGFLDPKLLDPLKPHLPKDDVTEELLDKAQTMDLSVPREIGAPVVSAMQDFEREAEAVYRKHASILDNAHSILADQKDLRFGTLPRIAQRLVGPEGGARVLPNTTLYAVRQALLNVDGIGFHMDSRSHRRTGMIQIRPKDEAKMTQQVVDWLREYQEDIVSDAAPLPGHQRGRSRTQGTIIIKAFIRKAQGLIARSRRMRDTTSLGSIGPSKVKREVNASGGAFVRVPGSTEFTTDEQSIIRFLEAYCLSRRYRDDPKLRSIAPTLLRAVGVYGAGDVGYATAYTFLQEIGVVAPFENRVVYDDDLLLPESQHSHSIMVLQSYIGQSAADFSEPDSMKSLRHDWKDLPVYCIDEASAEEIDDGISLERVEGCPNEYWIHIHVADPASFISRDHPIGRMAAHATETFYLPERTYPMISRTVSKNHFSLDKDRPTLTFSARINSEAEILDIEVRPGLIRNVFTLYPDSVNKILGASAIGQRESVLTVGGWAPKDINAFKRDKRARIGKREMSDLKTLLPLAHKLRERRMQAGGFNLDSNSGKVDVEVFHNLKIPGLPRTRPMRDFPVFYEGDPVIRVRGREFSSWMNANMADEQQSRLIVQEAMLLCCQVAAQWCAERNIPLLYRGMLSQPGVDPETYRREVYLPSLDEDGNAPYQALRGLINKLGAGYISNKCVPHRMIGVPGYAKVTSPLRRYGDMICHWQILAALREEARLGRSLKGNKSELAALQFSRAELDVIIKRLAPRERLITRTKFNGNISWVHQAFFRAFHFGEAELPETIPAFVFTTHNAGRLLIGVMLKPWSIVAYMEPPDQYGIKEPPELGDWWEVKIKQIQIYMNQINVFPIRCLSKEAQVVQ